MEYTYNARIKYSYLGLNSDSLQMEIGFTTENGEFSTGKMFIMHTSPIVKILKVLEVQRWEDLPRKFARIKVENGKVVGIGNLIADNWFII